MSKNLFMSPDYKPDKNTLQEIEKLHDDGVSLSGIHLKYADMKKAIDSRWVCCDYSIVIRHKSFDVEFSLNQVH